MSVALEGLKRETSLRSQYINTLPFTPQSGKCSSRTSYSN